MFDVPTIVFGLTVMAPVNFLLYRGFRAVKSQIEFMMMMRKIASSDKPQGQVQEQQEEQGKAIEPERPPVAMDPSDLFARMAMDIKKIKEKAAAAQAAHAQAPPPSPMKDVAVAELEVVQDPGQMADDESSAPSS